MPKLSRDLFAISTYSVQKVQLTPFELPGRSVRGIGDAGLHALDVTDVFDMVRRSVAGIARGGASQGAGGGQREAGDRGADALHSLGTRGE